MDGRTRDTVTGPIYCRDEAYQSRLCANQPFVAVVALLLILLAAAGGQAFDGNGVSHAAYPLLSTRVAANGTSFFVYQDADSGFNHGFPSGLFGTTTKIHLDTACLDDPGSAEGCATDPDRLDRERGTVLRIAFDPLSPAQFAGVNIEEPEGWGVQPRGVGYDLTNATHVVFEVRSPTPGGAQVQFRVGGSTTAFISIPQSATYTTMAIALDSLTPALTNLTDVHLLFAVATNDVHAPNGGTVLLDNIRFEPVPTRQQAVLGLPLSTQTFGVIPLQTPSSERVSIPPDQVNRNIATIYEAALTLLALLERGTPEDLALARVIAETFDYALHYDNQGNSLPVAPDGSMGLHNAYMAGDIVLLNDQGPGAGQAGGVRLAGFSASPTLCGPSGFCLVLDGATGGNNAFAILALTAAYRRVQESRYVDAARTIGNWIVGNLMDTTGTGYGGYYLGYPDGGVTPPKPRLTGKSVENNADIFSAFTALAQIERELGNTTAADEWTQRAKVAGDFVMAMFDPILGRFNAGTVPTEPPSTCDCQQGICPDPSQTKGNDVINTCDFLDANTFTTLALAAAPDYHPQIDWRRPIQFVVDHFPQAITAAGQAFQGFNLVKLSDTVGPNGIAWEFTSQVVVAMRLVDQLYHETRFDAAAAFYLDQLRQAQLLAPFGDGQGLVASTLQDGDLLRPHEQCLSTPFQCIPQRMGLAATTWAIFAERQSNPLRSGGPEEIQNCGQTTDPISCGLLIACRIDPAGDQDDFTFIAPQGAMASITIGDVAFRAGAPCWKLLFQGQTQVDSVCDAQAEVGPLAAGQYTIRTYWQAGAFVNTGDYGLSLQGVSQSFRCGVPIAFGDTRTDRIDLAGDTDTFNFSAEQNQIVEINVADIAFRAGSPCWALFNPDGEHLISSCANAQSGPLPTTGTYTIKVWWEPGAFVNIGPYTLSLHRVQ